MFKGALLNAQQKSGYTPLHEAVERSHESISKWLLDNGAKLDVQTKKGQTALHICAVLGRIQIASMLIQYGANVNIKDEMGKYCYDYSTSEELSNLLLGFSTDYLIDLGEMWDCGQTEVAKQVSFFTSFADLSVQGEDLDLETICYLFFPLDSTHCAFFVADIIQVPRVTPLEEDGLDWTPKLYHKLFTWGSCDYCQALRFMIYSDFNQRINSNNIISMFIFIVFIYLL